MKAEGLILHVENLVPGIVTLILILALLPSSAQQWSTNPQISPLLQNGFIASVAFVAVSYVVGVFTVAASRSVIATISSTLVRPVLLRWLYGDTFRGKTFGEVHRGYHEAIQKALYHSGEHKHSEVRNRRQRARILRSAIVPLVLFVWLLSSNSALWITLLYEFITVAAALLLCSYSEVTIYQESAVDVELIEVRDK